MKVRLAACTAPRPVPASTATSQNSHLACTKNESTVTTAHCTRVTVTTKRGPRVSVGRAHSTEPISALICTTMNRPMISGQGEAERLGREDRGEEDHSVHAVLVDEIGGEEPPHLRAVG